MSICESTTLSTIGEDSIGWNCIWESSCRNRGVVSRFLDFRCLSGVFSDDLLSVFLPDGLLRRTFRNGDGGRCCFVGELNPDISIVLPKSNCVSSKSSGCRSLIEGSDKRLAGRDGKRISVAVRNCRRVTCSLSGYTISWFDCPKVVFQNPIAELTMVFCLLSSAQQRKSE